MNRIKSLQQKHAGSALKATQRWLACMAIVLFTSQLTRAGDITYDILNNPADQNGATLTGTITTDGVVNQALQASDIVSWTWTVSAPGSSPYTLSSSDAGASVVDYGNGLYATSNGDLMLDPVESELSLGNTDTSPFAAYVFWQQTPALSLDGVTRLLSGLIPADPYVYWHTPEGPPDQQLVIAAVPEPSTTALAGLGAVLGGAACVFSRLRGARRRAMAAI